MAILSRFPLGYPRRTSCAPNCCASRVWAPQIAIRLLPRARISDRALGFDGFSEPRGDVSEGDSNALIFRVHNAKIQTEHKHVNCRVESPSHFEVNQIFLSWVILKL